MPRLPSEDKCCGCGACFAKCPVGAIGMSSKGILGATLPEIDAEKCISCGLCERTCSALNIKTSSNMKAQAAYAAYSNSDTVRFASSSGGMFLTFASHCIERGYKVFGAAFDGDIKLKCKKAESFEELAPLAKSKYLQSDMTGKYGEIEHLLQTGERVLFVSTPCQINALKSHLNREYENLLTVDFFCHGVPSQRLFDECREYEDKKYSRKTLEYTFRAKVKNGVTPHYFKIKYDKNGKIVEKTDFYYKSLFYALFQQYITLRESCYDCAFAGRDRASDITIGDFHEIDRYVEGVNRFDGISTVVVNSEKGKSLFEEVKPALQVYKMNIEKLVEDKTIFHTGTSRPLGRDNFLRVYNSEGLDGISKKYFGAKKYYKQAIYYRMPRPVRAILKKMM